MDDFYSLYQPNVFDFMANGADRPDGTFAAGEVWFNEAITFDFAETAHLYGCEVTLSARRLEQVRALWKDDVSRIRLLPYPDIAEDGDNKKLLVADHYKQAGYLAYWLRRRMVTKQVWEKEGKASTDDQKKFLLFGNEICSFLVGFHICLGFELAGLAAAKRSEILSSYLLDGNFLFDASTLLHHKNVSPQALYLIYRGLFYNLLPPGGGTDKNSKALTFASENNVLPFRRKKPQ